MWPLSWYQFCVSLPLEVRTVGLVLFLQVLTLFSVLHCLPPAGHVESVFSDSVFSAAVRCNTVNYITQRKKVLFATCAAPVPRYTRHDLSGYSVLSFPHSAGGSGVKAGASPSSQGTLLSRMSLPLRPFLFSTPALKPLS